MNWEEHFIISKKKEMYKGEVFYLKEDYASAGELYRKFERIVFLSKNKRELYFVDYAKYKHYEENNWYHYPRIYLNEKTLDKYLETLQERRKRIIKEICQ